MRKLAAVDITFLGPGLILAEFATGVLFSIALGVFCSAKKPFVLAGSPGWLPRLSWAQLHSHVRRCAFDTLQGERPRGTG